MALHFDNLENEKNLLDYYGRSYAPGINIFLNGNVFLDERDIGFFNRCAAGAIYIRFRAGFRGNKMTLESIK